MYRGKRKRSNEMEVEVKLNVPSRRGRKVTLVVLPNELIEDVKAKLHFQWHIPFDEKGDMWLLGPDDDMVNLPDGKLLREYPVVHGSALVYENTD